LVKIYKMRHKRKFFKRDINKIFEACSDKPHGKVYVKVLRLNNGVVMFKHWEVNKWSEATCALSNALSPNWVVPVSKLLALLLFNEAT
jgi:hypothetical protein